MQFLSRFFRNKRPFLGDVAPKAPFFAIGDVHGCDDLLARMLKNRPVNAQVVFVGDYIDRGEHSARVLRRVFALSQSSDAICLRGNHEQMMIDFLDDPDRNGGRWLRYGGLQTLASFQIAVSKPDPDTAELRRLAAALETKMGPALTQWVRGLPLIWGSGNVWVVHAAANPDTAMIHQSESALLWGHPAFRKKARSDGQWVVHGHTIVGDASVLAGVVSIDTGAYATGRLTAAHVTSGAVAFVTV